MYGHLHILEWLYQDLGRGKLNSGITHTVIQSFPSNSIEILNWLHAHGCQFDNDFPRRAAVLGRLSLLKWWQDNHANLEVQIAVPAERILEGAISSNRVDVIEWVFDNWQFTHENSLSLQEMLEIAHGENAPASIAWVERQLVARQEALAALIA